MWTDRKGTTQPLSGQSRQRWGTGRLSPDGRRVANGITGGKENATDIWVFDVERGTTTRLTFAGNSDFPIWHPDGRRIVYRGIDAAGKAGIYSISADGSAKAEKIADTESMARLSSFSPDGRNVLYDMTPKGQASRIFVLPFNTAGAAGPPRPLHDAQAQEFNGQVSPDGRWVSYETTESGTRELYVQAFPGPGAKIRVSNQGGASARWSRDGRSLDYWGGIPTTRFFEVAVTTGADFRAGTPEELFQVLSGTTWDVTPDRNRFLTEITTASAGSRLAIVTNWFDELRRRAPVKK